VWPELASFAWTPSVPAGAVRVSSARAGFAAPRRVCKSECKRHKPLNAASADRIYPCRTSCLLPTKCGAAFETKRHSASLIARIPELKGRTPVLSELSLTLRMHVHASIPCSQTLIFCLKAKIHRPGKENAKKNYRRGCRSGDRALQGLYRMNWPAGYPHHDSWNRRLESLSKQSNPRIYKPTRFCEGIQLKLFCLGVCCHLNGCLKGRFRLTAAIEKQRIAGAPLHRPVVPPGIPVRHAPERHPGDNIAVLQIDPK